MKVSVLINNYNYGQFIERAITSALTQTVPVDQIVVVDDGSTDNSVELIRAMAAKHPTVLLHEQKNSGQLAAMEAGIGKAVGDLLFFLDADDEYERDHVEDAVGVFKEHPSLGFYFCDHRESNDPKSTSNKWSKGFLGPSAYFTCLTRSRIGTITSTFVLHRKVAEAIFPFDESFHREWRVRADDCLVLGASLSGFAKYFHPKENVFYRIHGSNNYTGRRRDGWDDYQVHHRLNRLFLHFKGRFGLDERISGRWLAKEFLLIPRPERKIYRRYLRALWRAPIPVLEKLDALRKMTRHYWRDSS